MYTEEPPNRDMEHQDDWPFGPLAEHKNPVRENMEEILRQKEVEQEQKNERERQRSREESERRQRNIFG